MADAMSIYICSLGINLIISNIVKYLIILDEMGPMGQSTSSYMMPNGYEMDVYGDAPDKMTYTEQANKRSHCRRLTRYQMGHNFHFFSM